MPHAHSEKAPLASSRDPRGFPVPTIRVRPLTFGDLPALWRLHSDPRVFELDTIEALDTVDQMERVLGQWIMDSIADGFGYQLISAPDSTVLGVAGLSRMPLQHRWVANTYVRLFPEAWGAGIAHEALTRCITDVEELAGLGDPINGADGAAGNAPRASSARATVPAEAAFITAARNVPARRLAEGLGFRLTDEQDPTEHGTHVVYIRPITPARCDPGGT